MSMKAVTPIQTELLPAHYSVVNSVILLYQLITSTIFIDKQNIIRL